MRLSYIISETAPWQMSKEQFLKYVIPFKTAKGSVYAHLIPYSNKDGITFRIKSVHQGHDSNDHGLKNQSSKTVYVEPESSREVGMWNTLQASGKRIVDDGTNLHLVSLNSTTGKYGRDAKPIKYELKPIVGLSPIELWSPGEVDRKNWYRSNHPGNVITDLIDRAEAYEIFKQYSTILDRPTY